MRRALEIAGLSVAMAFMPACRSAGTSPGDGAPHGGDPDSSVPVIVPAEETATPGTDAGETDAPAPACPLGDGGCYFTVELTDDPNNEPLAPDCDKGPPYSPGAASPRSIAVTGSRRPPRSAQGRLY